MGVMNLQVGEALLGQRTTTTRQDEDTIITDHESSDESCDKSTTSDEEAVKGDQKGEVEKKGLSEKSVYLDESAATLEHGQSESRIHFSTVSAMELFKKAKSVRLKSHHDKYLTAGSNEESIIQDRSSSSKSAEWTVEFVKGAENFLRFKGCYGKYLTASDEAFLLGMTGQKVLQTSPRELDSSVEWEPFLDGTKVKLKARYGNYLRANLGLPPWRNSVTHDVPLTHHDWICWEVEIVDARPEGDLGTTSFQLPVSSFLSSSSSDQSSHKYSQGAEIEWPLSKENPGVVDVENIPKVLNSIINKTLILDGSSQNEGNNMSLDSGSSKGNLKIDLIEDDEEEVLELEFEKAVGKMHTHNIYCPNCSSQVTRVILRQKKPQIKDPRDKPMGLLGCLSCFSIFIPSAGNTLNPFRCFGRNEHESIQGHASADLISENGETIVKKGRVFDLFWIFGKREGNDIIKTPSSQPGKDHSEHEEGDLDEPLLRTKSRARPQQGTPLVVDDQEDTNKGVEHDQHQSPLGELPQVSPPRSNLGGEHIINFPQTQVPPLTRPSEPGYFEHGSKSLEILKSIVYGGLVESITSLSIVTSAAASETATMNIVALGLANVISGVFIVAHNLRDMKNECPVPNSNEQTDRYQELIGKREHFALHFSFAILSFLLFGLIPPAVYGFAFEKTDNRDYTIIAVAIASLLCIILLSIGKAYCKGEHKFSTYIKTISYYVSNAVAVSGVAYAVGDLIKIVVEKLGWFAPSTPAPATLFDYAVNSGTTFMASS